MITISNEVTFKFVLRMDIIVAEDLSNSTQYSIVKDKAEYAVSSIYWLFIRVSFIGLLKSDCKTLTFWFVLQLTDIYRKRLGNSFKSCSVTNLRYLIDENNNSKFKNNPFKANLTKGLSKLFWSLAIVVSRLSVCPSHKSNQTCPKFSYFLER